MRRFTAEEIHEIFDRIETGETPCSVALSLDRYPSALRELLLRTGGVRPPGRVQCQRLLSASEREEISRGLSGGESFRVIAARLDRSPSTVSREVGPLGVEPAGLDGSPHRSGDPPY